MFVCYRQPKSRNVIGELTLKRRVYSQVFSIKWFYNIMFFIVYNYLFGCKDVDVKIYFYIRVQRMV